MRVNVKACAITLAIVWGGGVFLTALGNRLFPGYGSAFLSMVSSLYPGYHVGGMKNGLVGTAYAALDGAVCGALLAWIYNAVAGRTADKGASVAA